MKTLDYCAVALCQQDGEIKDEEKHPSYSKRSIVLSPSPYLLQLQVIKHGYNFAVP